MSDEERQIQILVDGTMDTRRGVYSNASMARTSSKETLIDFVFIDSTGENGDKVGVVQSRIIMSNETFVEFRNMINDHFEKNFEKVEHHDE